MDCLRVALSMIIPLDVSGTVGDDEPYRRSELTWPLPASSGDS